MSTTDTRPSLWMIPISAVHVDFKVPDQHASEAFATIVCRFRHGLIAKLGVEHPGSEVDRRLEFRRHDKLAACEPFCRRKGHHQIADLGIPLTLGVAMETPVPCRTVAREAADSGELRATK
jgi:hypothetical protein